MTDKELLELAAKAAGLELDEVHLAYLEDENTFIRHEPDSDRISGEWNPLTSNSDAFQLMVNLNFCVTQWTSESGYQPHVMVGYKRKQNNGGNIVEDHKNDALSATRRAIVMAAAEIGKGM